MIAHELLYQQMRDLGALISASELHGHLCGRLVVGHELSGLLGIRVLADYMDLPVTDLDVIRADIERLVTSTMEQLNEDLFGFRLLLPDDDAPMSQRLGELAFWCQGFVAGLASTSGVEENKLLEAQQEVVSDLIEISRMESDDPGYQEYSDENESLYAEVAEFVRLSVFNFFDQFRDLAEQQAAREEIH